MAWRARPERRNEAGLCFDPACAEELRGWLAQAGCPAPESLVAMIRETHEALTKPVAVEPERLPAFDLQPSVRPWPERGMEAAEANAKGG